MFNSLAAEIILGISAFAYVIFWIWAIHHAANTPRASVLQRILWSAATIANPATAVWYWYVWKRQVFWALFTPILGVFLSLPLVVRSLLSRADETAITNFLFGLGSARLIILVATLMIFPLFLRLAALFHLGKNTDLTAMDRNDWIVSLALPVFGYGAGLAYCARYRRVWALVGFLWIAVIGGTLKVVTLNISQILVPAGDERREKFLLKQNYSSSSTPISNSSSSN